MIILHEIADLPLCAAALPHCTPAALHRRTPAALLPIPAPRRAPHHLPCELNQPQRTFPATPPARSVFLEERLLHDGAFTDALEADAGELRTLMGLGAKQAGEIEADVKQAAYKCGSRRLWAFEPGGAAGSASALPRGLALRAPRCLTHPPCPAPQAPAARGGDQRAAGGGREQGRGAGRPGGARALRRGCAAAPDALGGRLLRDRGRPLAHWRRRALAPPPDRSALPVRAALRSVPQTRRAPSTRASTARS